MDSQHPVPRHQPTDTPGPWCETPAGGHRLSLPADRPRASAGRASRGEHHFIITAAQTVSVRAVAAAHGVPTHVVYLALLQTVLNRYGEPHNITVAAAPHLDDATVVADGPVIVRTDLSDLSDDPPFGDLVRRTGERLRAAGGHHVPAERTGAVEAPDGSVPHPVEVLLAWQADAMPEASRGSARGFDLLLEVEDQEHQYTGRLVYRTEVFTPPRMERLAGQLTTALVRCCTQPRTRLSELDILPDDELAQMTQVLTRPGPQSASLEPVHRLVERQARLHPDAPAVVCGKRTLTYGELSIRVGQLAHWLREQGVRPESAVVVCLDRGPDLVVALLAVLTAGGTYVPLDPQHPAERIAYTAQDVSAVAVLTEERLRERVPVGDRPILCLDSEADRWTERPVAVRDIPVEPGNAAYVIYTSGSTGRPKGVQVTHGALANYLHWAVSDYVQHQVGGTVLLSSVAFDMVVPVLYTPLLTGRALHILPPDLDLARLGAALADSGPYAFVKLTPSQLVLVTEQLSDAQMRALTSTLVVGGEQLTTELAGRWCSPHEDVRVINEYGPTEATVGSSVFTMTRRTAQDFVPIGRPLPGASLYVLDESLRRVPIGVTGELCIAGAGLARGYAGQPGITAEKFVPDPFGPSGTRLYRTGDRARLLDDGSLYFLGRADDQVKIRGFRVELGEVESVLGALPQVAEARVVTHGSRPGDRRLVAYLVPSRAGTLVESEVRDAVAARLPAYAVPWAFVTVDALPLTSNGKLDAAALPGPDGFHGRPRSPQADERRPVEEAVCGMWRDVLSIDQVAVDDDFFARGGDSMSAVRLMFRIQKRFNVDLSVQMLFEAPTVEKMAAAIAGAEPMESIKKVSS
ncbi:amino acid adenylation domain-containing protein [Streptomyces sp. NPDC002742]|uniref:non-ribosomal peptide synthetase n=1 Tax=Streptomyces sp. NPDC002742 TaxID=3364663 RepID=UPI0036C08B1B